MRRNWNVDALEGLRLEVDPTTRQLKKIEALLALWALAV